eukprot:CAMPEP_0113537612 /NCGR_PEP_ID=MMETSP0015_2-20120614/6919_1 /TAXON_ID=2838 /ORGANISM="Odontella" /LENGTH=83 /DNA_ID=CAMNT_0000437119 /DNA_START=941 /DNA_END=1190 /DNA_ORIENTATION=- /assembly_acc=CAM_ASM_000160
MASPAPLPHNVKTRNDDTLPMGIVDEWDVFVGRSGCHTRAAAVTAREGRGVGAADDEWRYHQRQHDALSFLLLQEGPEGVKYV